MNESLHEHRGHPNSPHTPPNPHNPHYVEVSPRIFVGDRYACDLFTPRFDRIVHLWRQDHPDHSCRHVFNGVYKEGDLSINYADGRSLITESNPDIVGIENFLRSVTPDQSILIHCAAGQTRSNTIAFLLLRIRGLGVGNAMERLINTQWRERACYPNFCVTPMSEIMQRFPG